MTANLSKYNFLLQNDTDNFVVNSNVSIGDYNFDYLFTTYEGRVQRNNSKKTNKNTKGTTNMPTNTEILSLFEKALSDKKQNNVEKMLKNDKFITSFEKDDKFKEELKKVLDKYDPDNKDALVYLKIFTNSIRKLPEEIKSKYVQDDNIGVIMSLTNDD